MPLELEYWKNIAALIFASYENVDWDLIGEDIKVAKSMHEPYAAAELVVWGFADKSYTPKVAKQVIRARLLHIQLNSGLFKMVPLSL